MNTLKDKIKDLASKQLGIKLQRKTIYYTGTRTLTPQEARRTHKMNRETLRNLNMAYALIRGIEPEVVEQNPHTPIDMRVVEQIVELYKIENTCQND